MKVLFSGIFAVALIISTTSCKRDVSFPELGTKLAGPADIAVSADKSHFYVLNTDFDRTYNTGSILVIDSSGNKVKAIETPRLGRSISASGDKLFVSFNTSGEEDSISPQIRLYDITTPENPTLTKSWTLDDCDPLNISTRENYRYFAVTCISGTLMIGDLDTLDLKKVRKYAYNRRAIHIDTKRNLLYAFVTDLGRVSSKLDYQDKVLEDKYSWDEDFNQIEGSNEVPDRNEDSKIHIRTYKGSQGIHQFAVYDIAAEAEKGFPFLEPIEEETYDSEMHWMYFHLSTDTMIIDTEEKKEKYYRTNFWAAKPGSDEDSFYLSHRGLGKAEAPDNNQIIKVSIIANPTSTNDAKQLKTHEIFEFSSLYTQRDNQKDENSNNYTSDFEITNLDNKEVVIVNNFRDLANFKDNGGGRFTISAATFGDDPWAYQLETTNGYDGLYQFALGNEGTVASVSFYGNAVMFLEVKPGTDIREIKRLD